jgi:hypothetical protein
MPFLLLLGAEGPKPIPLTNDQIKSIQTLVRETRSTDESLQKALSLKQEELMGAYAEFTLEVENIKILQRDVLGIQQKLLTNYNYLQVELRKTVGKERFKQLKKRIDLHLKSSAKKKSSAKTADPKDQQTLTVAKFVRIPNFNSYEIRSSRDGRIPNPLFRVKFEQKAGSMSEVETTEGQG